MAAAGSQRGSQQGSQQGSMQDSSRSPPKSIGRESRRSSRKGGVGRKKAHQNHIQNSLSPRDLFTFGFGGQGALGNASFRDELEPFLVSSLRARGGVFLVSCGFEHTVALTADLAAYAWGRAAEGQLGLSTASDAKMLESPRGGGCVVEPALIGLCEGDAPATLQAVAAGGMHTLYLTMPHSSRDEPVIFSVGRGSEGQLGRGPSALHAAHPDAAALELPTELPATTIAAGGLHSAAVSSHGHLFVWGDSGWGQLGLPRQSALAPNDPNAPAAPPPAVSVAHLLPSWGFEGRKELEKKVPITISAEDLGGRSFVVRGRRAPPLQVQTVSCGQYHTAACTSEGELFTWGANGDGQLGLRDTHPRASPHRVMLSMGEGSSMGTNALQVACGGRHTVVLTARGEVWSCGCNLHGQLGQGTDFGRESLDRMVEVDALSEDRVIVIASGGAHTAAVTTEGALYTWGKNQHGQLGHGDVATREEPTLVEALGERVGWVACGGAHTAVLCRLSDGVAGDADDPVDWETNRSGSTALGGGASGRSVLKSAGAAGGPASTRRSGAGSVRSSWRSASSTGEYDQSY